MNLLDYAALEAIYARIPSIKCAQKCQGCCGPLGFTEGENLRFSNIQVRDDLTCSKLTCFGTCSIYNIRPTICRLWGVAEGMECPWGCVPERVLSKAEAKQILKDVADWSGGEPQYSEIPAESRKT